MTAALPAPGQLLEGKYEIVGLVGEGAWGLVLEGINVRIQRRVAIKILKEEYASNAQMVSRFEREALASTHIESPHVVQVFDAGVLQDGRPYLVMEFLTGEDLSTHISRAPDRRLPVVTAVDLCAQVARGLAAAHAAGVFHRDMKPSNIVIAKTKSGREVAKLVDFGISKLLDTTKEPISNTQTGTILGSPVYMSPEQARGSKTTDHRSDIYSLGVVLYECLTGTTPHSADSFNELLFKIVLETTPSARSIRPEIDEELDTILSQTLTKTPEQRIQTAMELEGLLTDWLTKHGARVSDSLSDSGPRGLELTASPPIPTGNPESSGQLGVAGPPSDPRLLATVALESGGGPAAPSSDPAVSVGAAASSHHPDTVARTIPAPSIGAGSLESSLTPSSSTARSAAMKATPSRRAYLIAGAVALAAVSGFVVIGAKSGGTKVSGSGELPLRSSAEPDHPTAKPTPPAGTAPSATAAIASARPTSAPSASASASAAATTTTTATARIGGGAGARPTGGVRPKPSASAVTTEPAPNGAGPASVGGRTIRTDL